MGSCFARAVGMPESSQRATTTDNASSTDTKQDPETPSTTISPVPAACISKTMPLRDGKQDPLHQQTAEPDEEVDSIDRTEEKGASSDSPLTIRSSPGPWSVASGSPTVASPAVAEIHIDETDELADQINAMGQEHEDIQKFREIFRHALKFGSAKEAANIFDELQKHIKTEPNPSSYLRAITDIIAEINADTSGRGTFEAHYLAHRGICDHIAGPILVILKRNVAFSPEFTKNTLYDGEVAINDLCVELVRFAANCMRCDIKNVRGIMDEEVQLYCLRPVLCINRIFQANELHNLVSETFWGGLWKIVHALCEPGGFFELLDPLFAAIYEKTPKQPKLVAAISDILLASNNSLMNLELIESRALGKDPSAPQLSIMTSQRLATVLMTVEKGLMFILQKHTQSLDLGVFFNQVDQVCTFQGNLYLHPPAVLQTRLQNLLEPYGVEYPRTDDKQLQDAVIKFPLYHQMLSCSRMDFRVRGLTKMVELLLQLWTDLGRNSTNALQINVIK